MQKPQTEGTIFINKFKDKDTQPDCKDKPVKENVEVKQEPVQQAQESSGGSNFEDEIPF
jgi:hypothetical protein